MVKSSSQQTQEDILSLIESEHRAVEELFGQLESSEDTEEIEQLFEDVYRALTLHARVEELVFYTALREYEETQGYLEEAEAEHNSTKILLEQMKNLSVEDSEFGVKMSYLQDTFLHHVEEEESEIFEAIRQCMDEEALDALGQEFMEAKVRITPDVEALIET